MYGSRVSADNKIVVSERFGLVSGFFPKCSGHFVHSRCHREYRRFRTREYSGLDESLMTDACEDLKIHNPPKLKPPAEFCHRRTVHDDRPPHYAALCRSSCNLLLSGRS